MPRDAGAPPIGDDRVGAFAIAGHLPATPESVEESNAAQVAAMIYTSGTTGNPKGVMLTHRNVLFIAVVSGAARALGADDLVYAVLPLSHVFGLASTCLGTINAGGALRLVNRFDPAHLAEALRGGVTVFQGVPAMYARLLEHLDHRGEALVAPRLRYMSAGGAPLDLDWKRRIEARFGRTLNNGYGLTEASPTVAQTRIDDPRDDDSIGPALPGVEIRFVDPDGRDVPEGEVGEAWVRGPNVMKGYYRDPDATAATITPDGWLRTGDLGRRGPDRNLFLVGRVKELIIRSGFNVYPPEVETALNAHPDVVQSAVVGRRVLGQRGGHRLRRDDAGLGRRRGGAEGVRARSARALQAAAAYPDHGAHAGERDRQGTEARAYGPRGRADRQESRRLTQRRASRLAIAAEHPHMQIATLAGAKLRGTSPGVRAFSRGSRHRVVRPRLIQQRFSSFLPGRLLRPNTLSRQRKDGPWKSVRLPVRPSLLHPATPTLPPHCSSASPIFAGTSSGSARSIS